MISGSSITRTRARRSSASFASCALAHPDPDDTTGTWECVDVEAVCDLPKPVTLVDVKANPKLADMRLVTDMRLSVQPVTAAEWAEVCRMGGLDAKKFKAR